MKQKDKYAIVEYYDVTSLSSYEFKQELPLHFQCATFKLPKTKIIDEDEKFIVLCMEEETTEKEFKPENPENPYREVCIIPKALIKNIKRYKR